MKGAADWVSGESLYRGWHSQHPVGGHSPDAGGLWCLPDSSRRGACGEHTGKAHAGVVSPQPALFSHTTRLHQGHDPKLSDISRQLTRLLSRHTKQSTRQVTDTHEARGEKLGSHT